MNVRIQGPHDDDILEEVETWWYEGCDLLVRFLDGDERRFHQSNVMERLP